MFIESTANTHATAIPVGDAPSAVPAVGAKSKQAGYLRIRDTFYVACWNVWTLLDEASQCIIMRSLRDYLVSIRCLSETRIPGTGHKCIKVPESDMFYHLYYSGPKDGSGRNGVALALDSNANKTISSWEPISSRIALARFKAKPTGLSVICAYAPTLPSDSTAKDLFHEKLQKAVDRVPRRDILIMAGDWNARTGKADADTQRVIGNFGL